MFKKLIGVSFALLIIAGSAIAWQIIRNNRLDSVFPEIKIGDIKLSVVRLMGHPWKDEECGKEFGGAPKDCTEEYIYATPFAPYDPTYWVIEFNADAQVINTVKLQSP